VRTVAASVGRAHQMAKAMRQETIPSAEAMIEKRKENDI
jgi:hypothetical protein